MADAVLIEMSASRIAKAKPGDIYAFATSNYRDFSIPSGDRRQPHPDLAELFDGDRSRYVYQAEGLNDLLLSLNM